MIINTKTCDWQLIVRTLMTDDKINVNIDGGTPAFSEQSICFGKFLIFST